MNALSHERGRVEDGRGDDAEAAPFPVPARQTGRAVFPHPAFRQASLPAHGDTKGRLRRAVQLPRKSSDPCGVVRLIANHRPSTSSKARLKQGSFPPPALPGFSSTMTLSDSHRVRIAASMELTLHPNGSPTLPASPFCDVPCPLPRRTGWRLSTPSAIRTAFPDPGGSASATALSRPAQASFAFAPSDRSTAQGGLCHEAPAPPVIRRYRSSATSLIDSSLGGSFLHW